MSLKSIVHKAARPLVIAGAIASIYVFGACARPDVNPQVVNPPIVENGSTSESIPIVIEETLESKIYKNLLFNVPEIKEFPQRVADSAVNRIKATIYDKGFAEDEQRAWNYITPAVRFGLDALDKIDFTKYKGANINQLSRFEKYVLDQELHWNNYSNSEIGQVLLPVELGVVNLLTNRRTTFNLDTALINVTSNPKLNGQSPQEWAANLALEDYKNKNSDGYKKAISSAREHTRALAIGWKVWINSNDVYQKAVDELLAEGNDMTVFLRGYPIALEMAGKLPSHETSEQVIPYFSVLLSSRLGMPAQVITARYPIDLTKSGMHDEPYLFLPSYQNDNPLVPNYFGFWLKKEVLMKDYEHLKPINVPIAWNRSNEFMPLAP